MDLIYLLPISLIVSYIINILADILPEDKITLPPACSSCCKPYSWKEYIFYKKCPNCNQKVPIRRWLVPILCLGVTILVILFPPRAQLVHYSWCFIALFHYFMLVFIIDLEHRLILYSVSLVGVLMAVPIGIYLHGTINTLLGLGIGAGVMLLLFLLGYLFVYILSRIRKEKIDEVALGFGDVILAGIMGLLLGYPGIVLGLLIAILLGGLVSLLYLVVKRITGKYESFTAIPYGPFLICSTLVLLYLAK